MLSRNEVAETRALTPPRIYLVRMGVFLVLAGFLVFILYRPIWAAFLANPGLNGAHPRRAADRHRAGLPPGGAAVPRGALGQRPRPLGRRVHDRASSRCCSPRWRRCSATGRPHRRFRLTTTALDPRFDRARASTRTASIVRYLAGPPRLPRPARHLLGPARHRRLGRQGHPVDAHRGRGRRLFDELKSGLAAPLGRHGHCRSRPRSSALPARWSSASSTSRPARPRAGSTPSSRTGSPRADDRPRRHRACTAGTAPSADLDRWR